MSRQIRTLPPERLLLECLGRNEGAWEEFLRRYADLIYSTILKVGLEESDRKDAFQSTVLAIYQEIDKLRDPARLPSWIIGIAYRQGVNRVRARMRSRETSMDALPAPLIEDALPLSAPGPPPDEERMALEKSQQVREAMELLPERCRRLLEMLFYEDPSPDYREVARREGIPIGSIGPTRARCIERLRRIFAKRGWST